VSDTAVLAIVTAVGGASWIATIVRAWLDHRDRTTAREADADNRFTGRLERRLEATERRLSTVENDLEDERTFTSLLVVALARAGIPIPDRPTRR